MRAIALVIAAALLAPAPARAKCAMPILEAQALTHAADVIPAGGGVLVGWATSTDWDKPRTTGDPTANPKWKLTLRKRIVATTMTTLAPGLTVYAPKKATPGKLALGALGTFTFGKTKKAWSPAAPVVKTVRTTRQQRGRGMDEKTEVVLDAAPPAEAYGVIVYLVSGKSATALTWAPITDPAATTIVAFYDDGRCDVTPPGMRAAAKGESIEVAWVDRFGRTSRRSAAVAAE